MEMLQLVISDWRLVISCLRMQGSTHVICYPNL